MFASGTKQNSQRWEELKVVQVFSFMQKFVCFCKPNLYNTRKCNILYTIYFLLFWPFIFAINAQGLYEKYTTIYAYMQPSVAILEAVVQSSMFITNFLASADFLLLSNNAVLKIDLTRNKLEKMCCRYFKDCVNYDEKKLSRICILTMMLMFSCNAFTAIYFTILMGLATVRPYAAMMFNIFQTSILVTKLYLELTSFKCLLIFLNRKMKDCLGSRISVWTTPKGKSGLNQVRVLIKIYSELFETVVEANSLYGFHFLTIITDVSVMVLHFSNYSMKIIVDALGPSSFVILLINGLLLATFITFGILITLTCDRIITQLKETLDTSHKVLTNLSTKFSFEEERDIKEALIVFSEYIHANDFHFSAAGLFPVDLTTLFLVFGSIAMYLVIIPLRS